MPDYNDILSKCEEAMKSLIDGAAISGLTVNTGLEDDELAAPYVVCYANGSQEIVRGTGLLLVSMAITVASLADAKDLAAHRTRVAQVFDAVRDDEAHVTLSAAVTEFYCYEVAETGRESSSDDRLLRNVLNVDLAVSGQNIS